MKKLVVLALLLVLVVNAACFGVNVAPPRSQDAPGNSVPSASNETARTGGVLRLVGADPPTLDPALTQDSTSSGYVVELFSGLMTLNDKLEVVPDIAESYTVSPDGKVYTFKLRKDVKFHNGKQVTANDFKYSVERATDPRTESLVADSYLGDIVGVKAKLRGRLNAVPGVKVVDDYTVEITIEQPIVYFVAKLTYPTAFIVDKENVEKGGRRWMDNPNGTGPFKLKEWRKSERIVLARNDNFYRSKARLDEVTFDLTIGSAATAMTLYENGEVDMMGVPLSEIDRVLDETNPLNKEMRREKTLSIGYIGFNVKVPPFDDPKVRQAFAHAVDKDKLISVVLKGVARKADGIVPPDMPGYNNTQLKPLGFDVQRAKQLISESKYRDASALPQITMRIPGEGANSPRTITAIAEMLKQNLGVTVNIQQTEWATFLYDLSLRPDSFQMFSLGWIADYPDPENFLDILFHSESLDNHSGYSNPELDKILVQARTEKDTAKRMAMYYQVEQMIVTDAPWIPLDYGEDIQLIKPYVKGVEFSMAVAPWLSKVWIAK